MKTLTKALKDAQAEIKAKQRKQAERLANSYR